MGPSASALDAAPTHMDVRNIAEEAAGELRPFDAEAFKSRSIDYATVEGRAGQRRDVGLSANAAEVWDLVTHQSN